MAAKFKNGCRVNNHPSNGKNGAKMLHIRISAGPQRDVYLHDLIFEAIIFGRREAYDRIHGITSNEDNGFNPEHYPQHSDRFYDYLDTIFETVDHDNNDSLDNKPSNLKRMTRSENVKKQNALRKQKREEEKQEQTCQ